MKMKYAIRQGKHGDARAHERVKANGLRFKTTYKVSRGVVNLKFGRDPESLLLDRSLNG